MVNYAADNQKLNGALLVESVKWTQAINNVNNVNNRNRVIFEKVWKEIVQEVQGSSNVVFHCFSSNVLLKVQILYKSVKKKND